MWLTLSEKRQMSVIGNDKPKKFDGKLCVKNKVVFFKRSNSRAYHMTNKMVTFSAIVKKFLNLLERPFLERLRYKCRYLQKKNLPDGSLIAFKEGIFKKVLTKEIHMWHPEKCPTGQIGLLVLLEHVKSGKMILVSTTHLVFNPYR
jgi:hypothetical protein